MPEPMQAEGRIPFDVPTAGKPCETWYKVVGDLNTGIPLVTAHGGPGAAHEYLLPFTDLHAKYGITVVFYDQIGCGQSTRLREKEGDEEFWSVDLFIKELDNLVDFLGLRESKFDLLGQSWGGMFGSVYAARQPLGLRKLILADAPASIPLMQKGVKELVKLLPQSVQDALSECHRRGDYESEKYKAACLVFYKRHLCRMDPWPEEINIALGHLEDDPTVYGTLYGPSELDPTGPLKDWEGHSTAHKIDVETLLINGRYDEVQDVTVEPWFHKIPKVKWIQLEKSSHMGHFEERERYMHFVAVFLGSEKALNQADHVI
jgi:L-proline amide hydrolase